MTKKDGDVARSPEEIAAEAEALGDGIDVDVAGGWSTRVASDTVVNVPVPPESVPAGGVPPDVPRAVTGVTEQAPPVGRVGRYTLLSLLGKGGMAEVFLAKQDGPAGFQKTCVVKRIRRSLSEEQRFIEMFLREARVAARLNHPNAVQIFELGQDGKEYFLAMEFLDGVSLHRAARRSWHHGESVPMEVCLRAVADAALGLHHAHSLTSPDGRHTPLIHRDVSPDNIMLTRDGVSKVLDFGIAKSTDIEEVTGTGEVKGKIPFMSPEQLRGENLDRRTDLWSLGVTMYWLLTGKRPFDAATEPMTIDGILRRDPKRPRELNPLIPMPVEGIVMQLLEKDREKRPANGAELADKLLGLLGPSAGYATASAFANKAMGWADQEPGQPISALTVLAARPESMWLKRLDEQSEGLARLFPESTPSKGWPRSPSGPQPVAPERLETAPPPSTGPTVTGLARQERRSPAVPIALGIFAAGALAIGAVFFMNTGNDPPPPPVTTVAAGDPAAPPATTGAAEPAPADGAVAAHADDDGAGDDGAGDDDGAAAKGDKSDKGDKGAARVEKRAPPVDTRASVRAVAPGFVTWKLSGRTLGSGSGTIKVPRGTSRVTAVDNETGGVLSVPVDDGVADVGKVPTGTLIVRAQPWAEVELGRKKLGTTPLDPLTLKAGRYVVRMVRESVSKNVTVDVKAGGTTHANGDLRDER